MSNRSPKEKLSPEAIVTAAQAYAEQLEVQTLDHKQVRHLAREILHAPQDRVKLVLYHLTSLFVPNDTEKVALDKAPKPDGPSVVTESNESAPAVSTAGLTVSDGPPDRDDVTVLEMTEPPALQGPSAVRPDPSEHQSPRSAVGSPITRRRIIWAVIIVSVIAIILALKMGRPKNGAGDEAEILNRENPQISSQEDSQ